MIVLSIVITEACNLNCVYCNVNKKSKDSIDPLIFLKTFDEVRANNPLDTIRVDFYGGEPLLYFHKIQFILENLKDNNVQFLMPTNGILLDQEKLDFLNQYNVKISLSYDGLWQDQNRPHAFNYIKNKKFFNNIKNFSIHTMIYPNNYNLLENHLFLCNYGANPHLTIVKDRNVWTPESIELLKKGIDELFEWYIEDTSRDIPMTILYYLRNIILFKSKGIEIKSCGAGKEHLSFSENKLIACNRFKDDLDLQQYISVFNDMIECTNCHVKPYCRKGCMYENIKNGKPIKEVCDIFKHFYDKIFFMLKELRYDENFQNIIKKEIQDEYGINTRRNK